MSVDLPLDQMSLGEKLELMERLWADLSRREEDLPSPDWHGDVLRERKRLVDDVKSLLVYAGVHARADGFFRMLTKRFPFAVYYLVDSDQIDVYAILDCRRDPTWIASRLRSARTGQ